MFTAVDGNKRAAEKGDFVMSLFIVVLPVMVFILCGFNHCIADTCYFFISKCANAVSYTHLDVYKRQFEMYIVIRSFVSPNTFVNT